MADSFNKKEREKKKRKRKQEKEERKKQRKLEEKTGNDMVYVDENGFLTSTPPDPDKKQEINAEDINIGVPSRDGEGRDFSREGTVKFFNTEKGYGFIADSLSGDSYFVHIDNVSGGSLGERDKVRFQVGSGPKGPIALDVKKI